MYSVKKLADLAGVSIRTLHLYDKMELLIPAQRNEAGYRLYGEKELYRLQQILFYRELDFSLQEIKILLDRPDFNMQNALLTHKKALISRRDRLDKLLKTIDKTISNLKKEAKMKPEELYEGLPDEMGARYRKEAMSKWGREAIETSENVLATQGKERFEKLKQLQEVNSRSLFSLRNKNPKSAEVQKLIADHYTIIRAFWGTSDSQDKQAEAYMGLGDLYASDPRYTGNQAAFGEFMREAMHYFASQNLH